MGSSFTDRAFGSGSMFDGGRSVESVIVELSSSSEDERAIVAQLEDTVADAQKLFKAFDLHHLPVVDGAYVKGIVSATDILDLFTDRPGVNPHDVKLRDIMTHHPKTIRKEQPIEEAIAILAESSYRCLPVVNAMGEIWSIITTRDIVRDLYAKCSPASAQAVRVDVD